MTRSLPSKVSLAAPTASLLALAWTPTAAWAQDAVADDDAVMSTVVVSGRRMSQTDLAIGEGEATNTVAVTREELLSAPAGISGLKMLETLPGFNVQTDGALGLYEFGNSVTARAFNLQQIGFVLDGVPMGRSDAFGGSPIFRYVDNENLGSVVASPGAGDVSLPSYASLGPIVSYNTIKPSDVAGGVASVAIGDDNLERTFLKLETGDINGFSAYVSRTKTDSDLWRGAGSIDREHYEGKLRYEWDEDTYLQGTYVSNDFFDYNSPTDTEANFESKGYDYGYSGSLPESCLNEIDVDYDFNGDGVSDATDFNPVATGSSCTAYYGDRINVRQDTLYSATFGTDLTENLGMTLTGYYEDKDGYGVSPDGYSNSLNLYNAQAAAGLDVTHPRGVQYGLSGVGGTRKGAVLGFTYNIANHEIAVGGWLESDEYHRTQQRLNHESGLQENAVLYDEVVYYRRDYTSTRDTYQYYLKDTISLMQDQLKVEVGFKGLSVDYALDGYRDYDDYYKDGGAGNGPQHITADYSDSFLPMVGAVYNLNPTDQIFGSYSQNYALPRGTDDIFSTINYFDADAATPDAEKSQNFEIGYRTNRGQFNGAVSLFYTSFDNRIVSSSVYNEGTEENETVYVNAGETEAYGLELSGVYQPEYFNDMVYFTGNLTYNHTELVDGFSAVNVSGNELADSPEWIFNGGVTFEPTTWAVANLSAKYTGDRYADYANLQEVEAYTVWSAYIDLGGENNFGIPENVSLRVNIDNVFDEEVLSYVSATTGTSPAYYRPLNPRTVQASLTVKF